VGLGYDIHCLALGCNLWLGGVKIPHTKGAVGHSDADTLIHALCDALLGAAALRDIGYHFPDTSQEFKGIDSKILLKKVMALITDKGFYVVNVDATVIIQQPRLANYIPLMVSTLSGIMNMPTDNVNIKAKTAEKLGAVGEEKGVEAQVIVLLAKTDNL